MLNFVIIKVQDKSYEILVIQSVWDVDKNVQCRNINPLFDRDEYETTQPT
jgi:hypothetical protein